MSETQTTPQQDLERLALRAATAISAYHVTRGMADELEKKARRCQAELLEALPEAGQIVKTALGTIERAARPKPRRSVNKAALDEHWESLPAEVRAFMDEQESVTVLMRNVPSEIQPVLREQGEVAVVRSTPKISDLEKLIEDPELREQFIVTPPAPSDIILLDGVGITSAGGDE